MRRRQLILSLVVLSCAIWVFAATTAFAATVDPSAFAVRAKPAIDKGALQTFASAAKRRQGRPQSLRS